MLKIQKSHDISDLKFTRHLKIAIVRTNYYETLNKNLEEHCRSTLMKQGVLKENIQTFIAPGSWEIPLLTQAIAKTKKFDAIVAFGIIVKGETYHFNMIVNECARALMRLSLDYSIPIAIEVLAVFNIVQAEERASDNNKNKGIEGAMAVLKTLKTLRQIKK